MAVTPTRVLILEYLEKHRSATAADLSRALGLTSADVRYHLKALHASGAVESVSTHTPAKRGRPARRFRLASASRPNDLPTLASLLLNFKMEDGEKSTPESRLQDLAVQYLPPPAQNLSTTTRLNLLIKQLNGHHYQARWEAHATGPRVVFGNCPFAPILMAHPELCEMDRFIIEQWGKMTAEQIIRMNLATLSPPLCIFQLMAARDEALSEKASVDFHR